MNDFEQTVVRTLQAKADQVVVDDEAQFHADDGAQPLSLVPGPPAASTRPRRRGWLVAVAAALAVLVGGAAVVRGLGADHPDVTMPSADDVMWSPSDQGVAALVPSALPEGWNLAEVHAGVSLKEVPTTWQLFGVDGASPLPEGVVVGSHQKGAEVLSGEPTHRVQGHPAFMGPTTSPYVPAGALEIEWAADDVFHNVVAVGLTEAALLDFLDSLDPRTDPATGFDVPSGASLTELGATTTDDQVTISTVGYADPDGAGDLSVMVYSSNFGGGLLHRLVGEPHGDGFVIRGGDQDYRFVSLARGDGSVVDVSTRSGPQDPGWLDLAVDSLVPVTRAQLVDMGVAQPVTVTSTVGQWTVEVHGHNGGSVAMCLTPVSGATMCTLAQSQMGFTTGSALVGGEWIVVALTDDSSEPATIETSPSSLAEPESFDSETLRGEREESDGHVTELVSVPEAVDAVLVLVATDSGGSGYGYDRPTL
ncbi:MAG TPA: hypothetical protein VGJ86_02605 [Acidimicrobiales bacterium]|jgi:hypothetical protein